MGEGSADKKAWKMRAVSVCFFVGLVCPPAVVMPLYFSLLNGESRKNESEECEYATARFGDGGDDRKAVRGAQPRDQGGVHRSPGGGVCADRATASVRNEDRRGAGRAVRQEH